MSGAAVDTTIIDCPDLIVPKDGYCWVRSCENPLPKRRRRWCSDKCSNVYPNNHLWRHARASVLNRDEMRCRRCGFESTNTGPDCELRWDNWLEVNHIVPRDGGRYGPGCHHHLSNLETLCHACHVQVTKQQQAMKKV